MTSRILFLWRFCGFQKPFCDGQSQFARCHRREEFFYHPARKKTLLHVLVILYRTVYICQRGGSIFCCCLQPLFSFPTLPVCGNLLLMVFITLFLPFCFFPFLSLFLFSFPLLSFYFIFQLFFLLFFQFLPSNGSSRYLSGRGIDVFQYIHFPVRQC
jgi:hypothetical protein